MRQRNKFKKVATITISDEVSAIVSGLKQDDIEALYDMYGLYTKNHFFDPRFKLGRWDGKIRFFKSTGKTYVQLIPEIIEYLYEQGYEIVLDDQRRKHVIPTGTIDKDYFSEHGYVLGDHQVESVNSIICTHNGIIRVGTGGGKTIITGAICHYYTRLYKKLIVIVPSTDLVIQTRDEIKDFGFSVGVYYGNKKEVDNEVVVSTWQSLLNNKQMITMFDAVIVDECHGSKTATQLATLLETTGKDIPIRIGLTGTLPKHDTDLMTVLCNLGPVRVDVSSSYLIDIGWLAKLNMVMLEYKEDFKEIWEEYKEDNEEEVKEKGLTYTKFKNDVLIPSYDAEKKYLIRNEPRMEYLMEIINEMADTYGNTFVLVNSVAFGKKMARFLGDRAIFIARDIKDRKQIYDTFSEQDNLIGIATYNLASTGIDIPRIFNFVMVDGGKSSIRVIQSIGRAIRRASDKDMANIVDFYSDLKFAKRHSRERKKIYEEENYDFSTLKIANDTNMEKVMEFIESKRGVEK